MAIRCLARDVPRHITTEGSSGSDEVDAVKKGAASRPRNCWTALGRRSITGAKRTRTNARGSPLLRDQLVCLDRLRGYAQSRTAVSAFDGTRDGREGLNLADEIVASLAPIDRGDARRLIKLVRDLSEV